MSLIENKDIIKKYGVIEIMSIRSENDWKIGQKKYKMEFRIENEEKTYKREISDETEYNSLKQYDRKLVQAKWNLIKGNVVNFSVLKILGDIA